MRVYPEPVEEAGTFEVARDHLTRFASLTDLSPKGGEVPFPLEIRVAGAHHYFSSTGGEVGEGLARTG